MLSDILYTYSSYDACLYLFHPCVPVQCVACFVTVGSAGFERNHRDDGP